MRFPGRDAVLSHFGLNLTGQKASFKREWMTGITVGAYMSDIQVQEVLAMANQHHPPLPVWKARAALTYELIV